MMKQYVYGIDVGGTTVKIGLFDSTAKLIEKWEIPTNKSEQGSNIIHDIYASIKKKTPNLNEVIGYGFGVPGPVVHNVVPVAVNLGWEDNDLKQDFGKLVNNFNIFVANDANVAALGEAAYGAGAGKDNVAMITLGTGVGCGIVVGGEVVEGYVGAAGELGHVNVLPKNPLSCNCGNSGCLETIASATGIKNTYQFLKDGYNGKSMLDSYKNPSAKAIFDFAKKNDELALKVVDYAAYYLGYACSILAVTTNPELIVFGGGVSKAGQFLIDKIQKEFQQFAFHACKDTRIMEAKLGNDAGIYGSARLVLNNG